MVRDFAGKHLDFWISDTGHDRYDWTDIVRHISKSVLNPLADARFQQDCFVQFWQEPT